MSEPRDSEVGEEERSRSVEMPRPRAVGSPLAMGYGSRAAIAPPRPEARPERPGSGSPLAAHPVAGPHVPAQPAPSQSIFSQPVPSQPASSETPPSEPALPERTLSSPPPSHVAADDAAPALPSGIQRAVNGMRAAWPFVQKILPLLDGQVITAVSNLLTPHHPPPQPPAQVNLEPLESSLAYLRTRHIELSGQLTQQNASLKRVEDRLEMVREATDRNTLEQQELMADLKSVGRKVNIIAVFALLLLAGSIAVNVLLFLHIRRVLP